mgnify:CR=1 FL=1
MQRFMEQHEDKEYEFGTAFHKYFHMHYNKENGHFVYGEPKLPVIQDELELCGYFAIISSEKMDAKDAINLYKSRDVSEKVFRADKTYLGNHCLRVASEEAASNKIFIGFLALIIRCRIYTALKEKANGLAKKTELSYSSGSNPGTGKDRTDPPERLGIPHGLCGYGHAERNPEGI